jgi:hypothetical protein
VAEENRNRFQTAHRDSIRDQAIGAAYGTRDLDVPARYEIHLDRKLERSLAMLVPAAGASTSGGAGIIRLAKAPAQGQGAEPAR